LDAFPPEQRYLETAELIPAIMKLYATLCAAILIAAPSFSSQTADAKPDQEPAKKTAKAKPYPLKTCIVTDEKLGEMGEPYVFTYQGREIKTCCKDCRKDFDKNPTKFLKKLDAAEKKAPK
jgi:hypothetical protein